MKLGKFSIHIKHFKATQLAGIDRHNRRLGRQHSNRAIDNEKSASNIALKPVKESLYKDTKRRIQEKVLTAGHRVTKSSIWITEVCCTLPQGIAPERSRDYFGEIVAYLEKMLGKDNIVSAYIHMDETRPHLHLDVIPLTADGHLSRKKIWTRQRLIELHDQLPKYLREEGYEVERGDRLEDFEARDRARLPLREYKIYREKEKLRTEYNKLVKEYNELADKYNATAREQVALKKGNKKLAQAIVSRGREQSR